MGSKTGEIIRIISKLSGPIHAVSWSHDGDFLAAGCRESSIYLWNTENWDLADTLFCRYGGVNSLAWAPNGFLLASGGIDKEIRLWDVTQGKFLYSLQGHNQFINSIEWSPDGKLLASGSDDKTIRIWDTESRRQIWQIEGHTDSITGVSFSFDGHLLASRSQDGTVRFWDCKKWVEVNKIGESAGSKTNFGWNAGLSFNPKDHSLATLGNSDVNISIWKLDINTLLRTVPQKEWLKYTSAKVVLMGESNVGKSCLAMRLTENRYPSDKEQETTHGMRFWQMEAEKLHPSANPPKGEKRDIVFWDMGGQHEYRLIHQMFLHDMALAIILIDPTRGYSAMAEAREWYMRLRKYLGNREIETLLVGTKQDQESPLINKTAIDNLCRECGFSGYFETSSKTARNIDNLRKAIAESINWENLANVSRPDLFQRIHEAIEKRRKNDEMVLFLDELKKTIKKFHPDIYEDAAFKAVSDQLATHGMIAQTRLTNGEDVVVLQLPVIELYAGSLIVAARNNPRGVPAFEERDLSPLKITLHSISDEKRLERMQERIVLECIVELMIEHGICFRHEGLLIFPTLFPEEIVGENEKIPHSVSLYYDFTGAIDNIYASLVARLIMTYREFGDERLYPGRVEFDKPGEGVCGIRQIKRKAGLAHLDLFFAEDTAKERRNLFTRFVEDHLREHGVEVHEHEAIKCRGCEREISEDIVHFNIASGNADVLCPWCRTSTLISEGVCRIQDNDPKSNDKIHALKKTVDKATNENVQDIKTVITQGLEKTKNDMPIRLLHLSDLHFTENTSPKTKFEWLVQDICRGEGFEHIPIEYIVISGDITDRGSEGGFQNALEFVSLLNDKFKVSAERCIFVPGNHDVQDLTAAYNWYDSEDKATKAEANKKLWHKEGNIILIPDKNIYPQRLKKFSDAFFHKIIQKPYPLDYAQQGIAYLFQATKIQFLTLNSAWEIDQFYRKRSGLHPEAVANVINKADEQIREAITRNELRKSDKILRICTWHHSIQHPEMMASTELLENLQVADVKVCLHGDVHDMNRDLFKYWHRKKIHIIGAGSFGSPAEGRPESIPRLYNLLEIKRDLTSVRVHTRRQIKPDGPFEPSYMWPTSDGDKGALPYYDIYLV